MSSISPKPDRPEIVDAESGAGSIAEKTEANDNKNQKKRNTQRAVAGGALFTLTVAGAFFAGALIGDSEGDSSTPAEASDESDTPSIDDRPPAPSEDFFSRNQSTDETEIENLEEAAPENINGSEQLNTEFTPRLMQGETPREVLKTFEHNYNCIHNAPFSEQQECIRYTAGDSSVGVTQSLAGIANWARDYREAYLPDTGFNFEISVYGDEITTQLDDPITDRGFRLIADVRDTVTGNGYLREFGFSRDVLITTETGATLDEPTVTEEEIYVLFDTRSVDPGVDISIGR